MIYYLENYDNGANLKYYSCDWINKMNLKYRE